MNDKLIENPNLTSGSKYNGKTKKRKIYQEEELKQYYLDINEHSPNEMKTQKLDEQIKNFVPNSISKDTLEVQNVEQKAYN